MQLSIVQLEFQIDDNSPLIVYDPPDAWQQVNSSSDPFVKLYYGETLTRASAPGAQAHFSFNGTGFAVYGGRKKQYAPFELKLDGRSFTCDASTSDDPQAAVRLCSKYNLTNTNHTATLISSTRAPFDIDKISWTTEMNSQHGRTPLETLTVDDADSAFTWDPPTAWTANPADLNRFRGSTGHSTATLGGSVTLKFKVQALMNRDHYSCRETHFHHPGEIVSIFGSIGPENAPYTAQIDGRPIKTYNATTDYRTTRSLLFFADNLGPGDHAVTLTNAQDRGDAVLLEVDYAEVQQFMPNAVVPIGVLNDRSYRIAIQVSAFIVMEGQVPLRPLFWQPSSERLLFPFCYGAFGTYGDANERTTDTPFFGPEHLSA
ncbi:hypothetical protein ONZ45_g17176 [Pleurotus djamor]|nr:hypothetical protein ONZ45_g17176 [Pleurotus djamor]